MSDLTKPEARALSLFWNLSTAAERTVLKITFSNTHTVCFKSGGSISLTSNLTSYRLQGLEEYTQYIVNISVVVRDYNVGGSAISMTTKPTGKR